MMRLGLLSLVLTGLFASASLAAAPKWTAKGAITTLRLHSITVHGQTCRITDASPARPTLRLYYVGAEAKIACPRGVLRAIDPLHSPTVFKSLTPVYPSSTQSSVVPGSPFVVGYAVSTTSTLGIISRSLVGGGAPITALTNTSITAGANSISLTCTIGDGSPNLGGLQIGDRVSRMDCKNGVLTGITRAA